MHVIYSTFTYPSGNNHCYEQWGHVLKHVNQWLKYDHQIEIKYYLVTGAGLLNAITLHFDK